MPLDRTAFLLRVRQPTVSKALEGRVARDCAPVSTPPARSGSANVNTRPGERYLRGPAARRRQHGAGNVGHVLELDKNAGYALKSFDVSPYKGQPIRVFFKATSNATNQTSFVVDDTSLTVK